MKDQGSLNLQFAQHLIDGLVIAGLKHAVISPGSRSSALTLVCERHKAIQTYVQIDERCAAFFALGLARENNQPVVVISTSGSAPGHWLPAIIEANHSGVPLILLSADRPPELLACGANQTIDQTHLFGNQVRHFYQLPLAEGTDKQKQYLNQLGQRVINESKLPLPGPVHLNIPFREPLLPEVDNFIYKNNSALSPVVNSYPLITLSEQQCEQLVQRLDAGKGVIVAGPDSHHPERAQAIIQLAHKLNVPVLADPLSGIRFGKHVTEHVLTHYDAFLRNRDFSIQQPEWMLRFGAMPVSKALGQYLQSCKHTHHILVDSYGRWRDPNHQLAELITCDVIQFCQQLLSYEFINTNSEWLDKFTQEEQATRLRASEACDESLLIQSLIKQLPDESLIFSSNSLAVRELDSFSACDTKPLSIIANRGASGIDGNISTLAGLAAARKKSGQKGKVVGLIGDLACYHDMNGLLAAGEQELIIIVINNGGGGIFYHLPQSSLTEFEQDWLTPHNLDFSKVASLYDIEFYRAETVDAFPELFEQALSKKSCQMIELIIDPEQSLQQHKKYWQTCTN
ncbi:MAG: 2-succinyl-5-enolpyruvyl-6-hydroxy-3-cyclohexene-1-carboxylic-acid synthase [Gammaproteobacteria bacterium]|nr:2-succinyl-5-enolpyruvyl-6-hydroxy-3-cyclohexene-1-carboxylic-acid synthase [Gammaproteobacteria bacterium]